MIDADAINVTAKLEGNKKGDIIKAKLFDFEPKAEGVPTKGNVQFRLKHYISVVFSVEFAGKTQEQ